MRKHFILLAASLAIVAGCNASKQQPGPVLPVTPVPQSMTPAEIAANPGSMFNDANANLLFEDSRAHRIGDIVMVKIEENNKAKNKANTSADRKSDFNLQVPSFFGRDTISMIPLPFGGNVNVFKGDVGGASGADLVKSHYESKLDSTGETKRENSVVATVASRVINVLPGGLLQVEGASETRVNDETQYLVVAGLVRSRDILSDNTVSSTQMADAKIAMFGKGTLADKQHPGWLTRVLDVLWPL